MYDQWARKNGYLLEEVQIDNKASSSAKKKIMTECLWMNYAERDRIESVKPS